LTLLNGESRCPTNLQILGSVEVMLSKKLNTTQIK